MSLLLFALLVFAVCALCIYVLRMVSPDGSLTQIGTVVLIIIGLIVIANRAGIF